MKKKQNAKNRRKATQINWEKSTDKEKEKVCGVETHCDEDDVTFDLANEIVKQFEEGKIDEIPEMVISYIPKEIDKQEFMEQLKEIRHDDLESMSAASNTINMHFRQSEEVFLELLSSSAEHGNFFSMKQLAECYKNEEYPRESEPEYLYWLNKIISDELVQKYIEHMEEGKQLEELSILSNDYLGYLAGSVSFELGLYYRNSDNLEDLKKALSYISNAEICGYPAYPGPYVTHEIEIELIERIDQLERYRNNQRIEHDLIRMFQDISIDQLSVDDQILELRKRLIGEIGEETWNNFREETRSCLVTAVSCFYYLQHSVDSDVKLDYSCVIIPLMKTLEHEVRVRFYNGYIEYLKTKLKSVESFFIKNDISVDDKYFNRGGVIYKARRGAFLFSDYANHQNAYTLGSFIYSTGLLDLKRGIYDKGKTADSTMIDYCRECLLRETCSNNGDVDSWLYSLAEDIDRLKETRNESAHGGNIKSIVSATQAMNDLLLIKKVLVDLIKECR